jgi:hypothetical protein
MVDSSHAAASDEEEAEGMSGVWIVSLKSYLPDLQLLADAQAFQMFMPTTCNCSYPLAWANCSDFLS